MLQTIRKNNPRIAAQALDQALRRYEPEAAAAFRAAVDASWSEATVERLTTALERGDLAEILRLTDLDLGPLPEADGRVETNREDPAVTAAARAWSEAPDDATRSRALSRLLSVSRLTRSAAVYRGLREGDLDRLLATGGSVDLGAKPLAWAPQRSLAEQPPLRGDGDYLLRLELPPGYPAFHEDDLGQAARYLYTPNGQRLRVVSVDHERREVVLAPEDPPTLASASSGSEWVGAVTGATQLPSAKADALIGALDVTNPYAVMNAKTYLPQEIREINLRQREEINKLIWASHAQGYTAPETARSIREIIGLTSKQSRAITNFRRQLETGVLGLGQRPWERRLSAVDRNLARRLFQAAQEGSPAARGQIDELVQRYHRSLVNRRAKDIARTEIHRAFIRGQNNAWAEAVTRGLLLPEETRRRWVVTPDDRLRPSHRAIPGMNKNGVGLKDKFETPFGPVRDPSDTVPELINCRCTVSLFFGDEEETAPPVPPKPPGKRPGQRQAVQPKRRKKPAPAPAPEKQWTIDQVREALMEKFRQDGNEHSYVLDQGVPVFYATSGSPNHVTLSHEMRVLLNRPSKNYEFHHNHPSGGSLSFADLQVCAHYRGLEYIHAHGDDGSHYRARIREPEFFRTTVMYNKIRQDTAWRADKMEAQEKASRYDLDKVYFHWINNIIANYGAMRYEAKLPPRIQEIYDKYYLQNRNTAWPLENPEEYIKGLRRQLGIRDPFPWLPL